MYRDPYLKELGQRIQAIRKERKLTVRQFGEMCNIHYSAISMIEGGRYSSKILTLKNIAEKLEVDIKDIV